jgi:hypothetical protein
MPKVGYFGALIFELKLIILGLLACNDFLVLLNEKKKSVAGM